MKTGKWLLLSIPLLLLALYAVGAQREAPGREIMKEKLALAQDAIAGIATEDWALVLTSARRLRAATQAADWRAFNNPGYESQTALFRTQVTALAAAAEKRDIDAATLAYVKVTLSCVDCHKMIRGKELAHSKTPPLIIPMNLLAREATGEANR